MQPPFITNIFCDLYRMKQLDLVLYSHYTMCRTREQEISPRNSYLQKEGTPYEKEYQ